MKFVLIFRWRELTAASVNQRSLLVSIQDLLILLPASIQLAFNSYTNKADHLPAEQTDVRTELLVGMVGGGHPLHTAD